MTEDAEKVSKQSPWYSLVTLYGTPAKADDELHARNRAAWNRCMANKLSEMLKAHLAEISRHPAIELTPFSDSEAGRVLFLYTPAAAGHYLEEMVEHLGRSLTDDERRERLQRHRWEVVGPNPL